MSFSKSSVQCDDPGCDFGRLSTRAGTLRLAFSISSDKVNGTCMLPWSCVVRLNAVSTRKALRYGVRTARSRMENWTSFEK